MNKKDLKPGRCYFISTDREENPKLGAKLLSDGRESLFLEFYFGYEMVYNNAKDRMEPKKQRRRESLKLFLWHKPRTPLQREENKNTLSLAKKIRHDKGQELLDQEKGYKLQTKKAAVNFLEYFQEYIDDYTKKDVRVIEMALRRFKEFLHDSPDYSRFERKIRPEQLTSEMMMAFVEYLQGKCKGEGAKSIYQRFKKVYKSCAVKCNINHQRPFINNDGKSITITADDDAIVKDILSPDEVKRLKATHYHGENPEIRNAFIFCLHTGMRWCDVKDLTFGNIDFANKMLSYEQNKTKGHSKHSSVTLYLSDAMMALIADKIEDAKKNDLVFHLPSHTMCLKALRSWVKKADIDKHITWHCARHTFGTLMASQKGISIRTVQESLGHSNLKYTERYTRVADEQKKAALAELSKMME